MLKLIMKAYLYNLALHKEDALPIFRLALQCYLAGDPSSVTNKLHLKRGAAEYFYGKNYQKIVDAIDQL